MSKEKLSNGIYICPTPIGNMEDITIRALELLKECDLIACEDTRHTVGLLSHFDIHKPLVSYHKFNENSRAAELVEQARSKVIAVVSDAGMPGISDPGFAVVKAARDAGVYVTVLPGASAAVCAAVLSGLPCERFIFEGFLPSENKDRKERLSQLVKEERSVILYESPHRLAKTLAELAKALGERKIAACRELSKLHEECVVFELSKYEEFLEQHPPRGEYVLVVQGAEKALPVGTLEEQLEEMLASGMDKKEAVKAVAKANGVSKNEVYMLLVDRS